MTGSAGPEGGGGRTAARSARPGLGGEAAAPGDAGAGPGLSLLNLGRRRARTPGSRAMALRELKVCLLGDTGVGKSSIVWRFVEDSFDPNINPTIGSLFIGHLL